MSLLCIELARTYYDLAQSYQEDWL